jgi:hypothetical protein
MPRKASASFLKKRSKNPLLNAGIGAVATTAGNKSKFFSPPAGSRLFGSQQRSFSFS